MKEINFGYNSALFVWWFVAWRTALALLVISFVSGLFGVLVESILIQELIGWAGVLLAFFGQVYFIKLAVNRDFNSKYNGRFRLAALALKSNETDPDNEA